MSFPILLYWKPKDILSWVKIGYYRFKQLKHNFFSHIITAQQLWYGKNFVRVGLLEYQMQGMGL